tara:strand:+ start:144 stop:536 length:393 start_codon:yes stop_codon:yes gene_type:complete
MEAEDGDAFELALNSAFQDRCLPAISDLLIAVLPMTWHSRHEDVVGALQDTRAADAVGALFDAAHARHSYLDYDDAFGLARKCTWALADIGTDAAKEQLHALTRCGDSVVQGYAQERLDRWDQELDRKRR